MPIPNSSIFEQACICLAVSIISLRFLKKMPSRKSPKSIISTHLCILPNFFAAWFNSNTVESSDCMLMSQLCTILSASDRIPIRSSSLGFEVCIASKFSSLESANISASLFSMSSVIFSSAQNTFVTIAVVSDWEWHSSLSLSRLALSASRLITTLGYIRPPIIF